MTDFSTNLTRKTIKLDSRCSLQKAKQREDGSVRSFRGFQSTKHCDSKHNVFRRAKNDISWVQVGHKNKTKTNKQTLFNEGDT